MKESLEIIEARYKIYIDSMNQNLNNLEVALQEHYGKDYKLSYTEESMHAVEYFLDKQLEEYTIEIFPLEQLLENIATYMGETVRRLMNGIWELERQEDVMSYGLPFVGNLDGLPKDGGYVPMDGVLMYKDEPRKGFLAGDIRGIIYAHDPSKW